MGLAIDLCFAAVVISLRDSISQALFVIDRSPAPEDRNNILSDTMFRIMAYGLYRPK